MSVIDVVTISSPGSGSIAATATCTAAVPDAQATAARVAEHVGEARLERGDVRALRARERAARDRVAERARSPRRRACARMRPGPTAARARREGANQSCVRSLSSQVRCRPSPTRRPTLPTRFVLARRNATEGSRETTGSGCRQHDTHGKSQSCSSIFSCLYRRADAADEGRNAKDESLGSAPGPDLKESAWDTSTGVGRTRTGGRGSPSSTAPGPRP